MRGLALLTTEILTLRVRMTRREESLWSRMNRMA
jgi:hypothetical protein